jgi:hypothetical protein
VGRLVEEVEVQRIGKRIEKLEARLAFQRPNDVGGRSGYEFPVQCRIYPPHKEAFKRNKVKDRQERYEYQSMPACFMRVGVT